MRYMKYWVVIKMLWNILLVGVAVLTAVVGLTKWELKDIFYIVGIEFFIWFMVNEILEMFKPIPIMIPPKHLRGKNNETSNDNQR